uniref:Adenosine deaminase RNA specific B1 n=1 Tax=Equus asinus asinus TaxID=83772 RepID=A0A8C4PJD7_EQUAS
MPQPGRMSWAAPPACVSTRCTVAGCVCTARFPPTYYAPRSLNPTCTTSPNWQRRSTRPPRPVCSKPSSKPAWAPGWRSPPSRTSSLSHPDRAWRRAAGRPALSRNLTSDPGDRPGAGLPGVQLCPGTSHLTLGTGPGQGCRASSTVPGTSHLTLGTGPGQGCRAPSTVPGTSHLTLGTGPGQGCRAPSTVPGTSHLTWGQAGGCGVPDVQH